MNYPFEMNQESLCPAVSKVTVSVKGSLVENTMVTLSCEHDGRGPWPYKWLVNGSVLDSTNSKYQQTNGNLIFQISRHDGGTYECSVEDAVSTKSARVDLVPLCE